MHEAQLDGAVLTVSIVLPRRRFSHSPSPAQNKFLPGNPERQQFINSYDAVSGLENGRNFSGGYRSSHRGSPSRRFIAPRVVERHDLYRPRSVSRSLSPRGRSPSASVSRSRSPQSQGQTYQMNAHSHWKGDPGYDDCNNSRSVSLDRSRSPGRYSVRHGSRW